MPLLISISDPTRPLVLTVPDHGSVMREISFSEVDFPLPLGPMMPTASPSATSKETSASAQMFSTGPPPPDFTPERSSAEVNRPESVPFVVMPLRRSPSLNRFHTCSTWTTGAPLDDIGEAPVDALVPPVGHDERDRAPEAGDREGRPLRPLAEHEDAAEPVHHRHEGVQVGVQGGERRRERLLRLRERIRDPRRIEEHLRHHRRRLADAPEGPLRSR